MTRTIKINWIIFTTNENNLIRKPNLHLFALFEFFLPRMNATKAMLKMLTGDIKMLSEFVSKFELQVEMFAVLNFSSTSEIAIVDFVKMSNFLITERMYLQCEQIKVMTF